MIEIHRYTAAYHRNWNDFVSESSNGTFLFLREYMEYHADRFTDYSLLVYDGNKLLALLPANRSGDVLYSHAGLTYGGLIVTNGCINVFHISIIVILLSRICMLYFD